MCVCGWVWEGLMVWRCACWGMRLWICKTGGETSGWGGGDEGREGMTRTLVRSVEVFTNRRLFLTLPSDLLTGITVIGRVRGARGFGCLFGTAPLSVVLGVASVVMAGVEVVVVGVEVVVVVEMVVVVGKRETAAMWREF
jgi:hypothetical protein